MPKVAGKEVRSAHTKKCCFSSCRRWGHSLGRPCWPPSAYKHFGTHRGEQFVANKKAILSRHDSIQSIAVSCHVHMYAYICIYSCMHRLFLHMISFSTPTISSSTSSFSSSAYLALCAANNSSSESVCDDISCQSPSLSTLHCSWPCWKTRFWLPLLDML